MSDTLREIRCPKCPPIIRGKLLFKAEGQATIQIKCSKCGSLVTVKLEPKIKEMSAAAA